MGCRHIQFHPAANQAYSFPRFLCSQAEGEGSGTTVPGMQLGKKKEANKSRGGGVYTNLNDLRRMLGLPPMIIPSTLFDENDPTNDFEAVRVPASTSTCVSPFVEHV